MSDPDRIVSALSRCGWVIAAPKPGVYARLAWPDLSTRSLLVPLDRTAPEFDELLRSAICQLEAAMFTGQFAAQALTAYKPDLYSQYA